MSLKMETFAECDLSVDRPKLEFNLGGNEPESSDESDIAHCTRTCEIRMRATYHRDRHRRLRRIAAAVA